MRTRAPDPGDGRHPRSVLPLWPGRRCSPGSLLLERCDDQDRYRVETQIAASQFAAMLGEFAEADRILAQAQELGTRLDDPVLEAWTRSSRACGPRSAARWTPAESS